MEDREAVMTDWTQHEGTIDPENFRGEGHFLSEQNVYPYEAMTRTLLLRNPRERFIEDNAFGCVTSKVSGLTVSRDLLDSLVEINFLTGFFEVQVPMSVLDIGAGYGRFAHRWTSVHPESFVTCTDPIATSRQCCLRYLTHRKVKQASVVQPGRLGMCPPFDLAVNIHSWPECTREEINGWLDFLVGNEVPRLFVVPHQQHNGEFICIKDGLSFRPDIEAHGYKLEHYYRGPAAWPRDLYLFRLESK